MALINCPECNNEVSDQSAFCIHCGYPIKKNTVCEINGIKYDLSFILDLIEIKQTNADIFPSQLGKTTKKLSDLTGCYIFDAADIITNILQNKEIPHTLSIKEQSQKVEDNKPKCPTCGSTNIEKISTAKKVTGGFLFGLFSSDVRNTMHCKKCGHKW